MRTDKKLEVVIRPPQITVTAENKDCLQLLDVLNLLEKALMDEIYNEGAKCGEKRGRVQGIAEDWRVPARKGFIFTSALWV